MKYPNAFKGIKKVYAGELLGFIGTAAMLVGLVIALVMTEVTESTDTTLALISLLLIIGGIVVICIGFIFSLVGIGVAGKDEEKLKVAFYCFVFGLVAAIVSACTQQLNLWDGLIAEVSDSITEIMHYLAVYYVVEGVCALAEKYGNKSMVEKGKHVLALLTIAFLTSICAEILGDFVVTGTAGGILEIVAKIIALLRFVLYLAFLADAKRMLSEKY